MIYLPKTQPAPPCLEVEKAKNNGTYHCDGVLEQIRSDFKNKCYICEDKEPHSINIEHFIPHRGDRELKFDWNNLFLGCVHCNSTKGHVTKYDDILNCTLERNVETIIRYHIDPWPKEKAEITPLNTEEKVLNTVDLLLAIYNGTTELKKLESANLRNKLLKEIRVFQDMLFDFYDDSYTAVEKEDLKNKILRELRPTSNFTAFKKWILRDNEMSVDFREYL